MWYKFIKVQKIEGVASPERQRSALQRCGFVLGVVLSLDAARVLARVSVPGQLAVDVQQTVGHHGQLRIPAD